MSLNGITQIFLIGHTVTTSLLASNGLGRHMASLSQHNLTHFQKVQTEIEPFPASTRPDANLA